MLYDRFYAIRVIGSPLCFTPMGLRRICHRGLIGSPGRSTPHHVIDAPQLRRDIDFQRKKKTIKRELPFFLLNRTASARAIQINVYYRRPVFSLFKTGSFLYTTTKKGKKTEKIT